MADEFRASQELSSVSGTCDANQTLILNTTKAEAERLVSQAYRSVSVPKFETWFGRRSAEREEKVKANYAKINRALVKTTFDCTSCDAMDDSAFAYVYPNKPYTVFLCNRFWVSPNSGTDSKPGTLIQKVSHFYEAIGAVNASFSTSQTRALAKHSPEYSIVNANSYGYFVEH